MHKKANIPSSENDYRFITKIFQNKLCYKIVAIIVTYLYTKTIHINRCCIYNSICMLILGGGEVISSDFR